MYRWVRSRCRIQLHIRSDAATAPACQTAWYRIKYGDVPQQGTLRFFHVRAGSAGSVPGTSSRLPVLLVNPAQLLNPAADPAPDPLYSALLRAPLPPRLPTAST